MTQYNIKYFKDKENNKYAFSEEEVICECCNNACDQFIILKQFFYKGMVKRFYACSGKCSKSLIYIGDAEVGTYLLSDTIRKDFVFIAPEKVEFQSSSKINSITAVNKLECQTIDKTRFAGRDSLEGASVGLDVKELEDKDQTLSLEGGCDYLDSLANAKVLIESSHSNKKKLRGKK